MSELILENKLSKNWCITSLGDVVTPIKGKKPKILGEKSNTFTIPYITIQTFEKNIFENFTDDVKCPRCDENDVLIVWDGSRSGLVGTGVSGVIGSTIVKLFCYDINQKYLYYFLQKHYNIINKNPKGIGIPHVNPTILWNLKFPIPPVSEQKRIVAKIEELFSLLDFTIHLLKNIKNQLKQYRQSLLLSAFKGNLALQDPNDEPSKNLLQKIKQKQRAKLEEEFKIKGKDPTKFTYCEPLSVNSTGLSELPSTWEWATIDQICYKVTDGEHITPQRQENGVLLLSARNVLNGRIILDDVDYISKQEHQRITKRLKIHTGDVLLTCSGSVGRSCVVPPNFEFSMVRSVAVIKPVYDLIDSDYLSFALRSHILQDQIAQKKTQTAQANIFQGKIKMLLIPLSPLNEQKRIVAKIDESLSVVEKNEKLVNLLLLQNTSIKNSILEQAFKGKLVPQDPNDKPAEILLEKIKQEKQKIISQTKRGKKNDK